MGKAFLYGIGGGSGGALQEKSVALNIASGDQPITPDQGYDGMSKVVVLRPATAVPENIKKNVVLGGITGTYEGSAIPNALDDLVDGTLTTFTMPEGKTKIKEYLFRSSTALTYANLQGATRIEQYAFYYCTNAEILLPSTLTNVATYAFNNAGKSTAPMELNCPVSPCTLGTYAFSNSRIISVKGKFGSIGERAFYRDASFNTPIEVDITQCSSVGNYAFAVQSSSYAYLTKLHLVLNGSIGNYAFQWQSKVNDLSITGVVTSIGSNAFYNFAYNRQNPAQNVLTLDFSASTFTSIGSATFAGQNANNALNYFTIILPESCNTIGSSAFGYIKNSNIFFLRELPATIQSNTFNGMSNTTLWVPYNSVNAHRIAANWNASAVSSAIKGYAKENTFTTGQTLPTINEEGYGCTWYSDIACTTQVTTVADETQMLYCIVGTTPLAYRLSIATMDCSVVVSDGVNTYQDGDLVPSGASIEITTSATDPSKNSVFNLKVNTTDYAPSSSVSTTMSGAIKVIAVYYDGINDPYFTTLNSNTWEQIRKVSQAGFAGDVWTIGSTKTGSDGHDWTLVDLKTGRYAFINGTGYTNTVFMKNTAYVTPVVYALGTDNSLPYPQGLLYASLQQGGSCYQVEDQSLATIANSNRINVISMKGNTSYQAECSFFTASLLEIGEDSGTGFWTDYPERSTICNGKIFGKFQYFDISSPQSRRIKTVAGTSTTCMWWLRDRSGSSYQASCVQPSGYITSNGAAVSQYVVPCVAL